MPQRPDLRRATRPPSDSRCRPEVYLASTSTSTSSRSARSTGVARSRSGRPGLGEGLDSGDGLLAQRGRRFEGGEVSLVGGLMLVPKAVFSTGVTTHAVVRHNARCGDVYRYEL